MNRNRQGFTLLELLIGVAIIAILAAVALPNMLEAQRRAKTAKAKANIRVLLDGADAYRIDWNAYPSAGPHLPDDPYGILADAQLRVLTTPISYISTAAFSDPFGLVQSQSLSFRRVGFEMETAPRPGPPPGPPPGPGTHDPEFPIPEVPNRNRSLLYYHYPDFAEQTGNPKVYARGMAIVSLGPDQLDSFGAFRPFDQDALPPLARQLGYQQPIDTQYDPTNGTVSRGDLFGFTGELSIQRIP
ncbi:prepilin-type N-terminal cleavage/methylation domain-containing protein [bacterium]|nr:prepilin-type N-terminal cleavage/methylation domain-containing protein [bacterium]